jgi:hypothetical protein
MVTYCHCGKPLHYTDRTIELMVTELVRQLGEHIKITVDGRTWLVQRHYIALHGIKGSELPHLGFQEVTNAQHGNQN